MPNISAPCISLFSEFLQEETSFPSEVTRFRGYFALLTSVLGHMSKHKSSSGLLSSSTVLQHCPSRCCMLEHSACGHGKCILSVRTQKYCITELGINPHNPPSAWNFKLTPKDKIQSVSQVSCWFPFPQAQMLVMQVWRPEHGVQGQQSVLVPSPSTHHCHSTRGRSWPSIKDMSLGCGTQGFGDCTSPVSRLYRRAASKEQQ